MKQILLQIGTDNTKVITSTKSGSMIFSNAWMWVAIIEFIFIALLVYKLLKTKKTDFENIDTGVINQAKSSNIDMDNLMNSINNSKQLYKRLSAMCHPDRFSTDEHKRQIADSLFQEITRDQRNYNKLLELKEKAQKQLNITI